MRNSFLVCFVLSLIFSHISLGATLAESGKTPYIIVVAPDAIASEQTAAHELQSYLHEVTGATFAISAPADATPAAPRIWVGQSAAVRKLLPAVEWPKLPADAIVMQTVGNDLVLAGGRPRGALYAVYTFLEDVVGVQWWTSTEQFVPQKSTLELPALNVHYQPQFRYREAYYRDVVFDRGAFAARLKLNGHNAATSPALGGHYSIIGFCHTFEQLLPPAQYFHDHPEWYSLIKGKRTHERAQLCLTNEAMRKELTRVALERIRQNPTAGIISISQNDCGGACECDKCKALREREGAESGPLLHFVNAVAKDIAREYPDFLVHTLAYTYTETPPLHVKPEPNVMVQLCSMGSYFDCPLDSEANQRFGDNLANWGKLSSNLFIWDYVTNFSDYHLPHPNLQVLGPNIKLFAKNNVVGVFEQGDTGSLCGDFVQLRAWLIAHLLWNPAADEQQLVQKFLQGYYGAAAPNIAAYLDLVRDAFLNRNFHLSSYNREVGFLSLAQMNQATQLFNDAEKAAAQEPALLVRIKRERISLDHLWLLRYPWLKRQAEAAKQPFLGPADPAVACDELVARMQQFDHGKGNSSEGRSLADYVAELKRTAVAGVDGAASGKTPPECAGLDPLAWLEVQDDQLAILGGNITRDADPAASNGKAVGIPGSIYDWFVRTPVTGDMAAAFPKAECLISARCDAGSDDPKELVLSIGLYNETERKNVFVANLHVRDFTPGQYKTFSLGTHPLPGNSYFWIVSSGKGDKIRKAYVDRMIFIRKD